MKLKCLVSLTFLVVSASAVAAPHLTHQQCNDYPFKPLKKEVTHAQLEQELAELEAVGYDPSQDDNEYPQDLMTAQHKLSKEYARDCTGALSAQR
ncbi:DUF4148 domain-containing protein [Paraburkholderia sp. Ac-20340]|uniref:DUF4148 domain-containing protein n=1 Tax=Paraburkholderia sp. Ac-20340 TaxID=2703888 RepID=UPI00197F32D0|nr:DUF4148 domain-containing protein [Paraburkholderia sp. Ac-20340]MBN3855019.1 DUF4148 domain-containing protein [Paraburkholderia sp. Ac-20340]